MSACIFLIRKTFGGVKLTCELVSASHGDFLESMELCTMLLHIHLHLGLHLALINRAGGLYGRILTEVVSTDRTQ